MKAYGKASQETSSLLEKGEIRVAVYGLGKMGLPLAALFADAGAKVTGVDISEKVVSGINAGVNHVKEEPGLDELVARNVSCGRLKATTDAVAAARDSDVQIILVPTLIKDHKPDLTPVHAVARNIAKGLSRGNIVITECTMPPGSTESLISILDGSGLTAGVDYGLGHCPERTMTGTAIADIKGKYPKIVGAINNETLEPLVGMYSVINAKGVIPVSGIKAAELVKVFEGIYRDVNIALANELEDVCRGYGVNYVEIQKAANTQPYSHLHTPGGVGGHCIPYYPYFVMNEDTTLIRTARELNDSMPERIVSLTGDALKEAGKSLGDSSVLVLGISFRGGVKETIKSTGVEIIEALDGRAKEVYVYDPMYSAEETGRFGTFKEGFDGIDAVILAADHREFKSYDWEDIAGRMGTKVFIDTRQAFDPGDLRAKGFVYRGVGFI